MKWIAQSVWRATIEKHRNEMKWLELMWIDRAVNVTYWNRQVVAARFKSLDTWKNEKSSALFVTSAPLQTEFFYRKSTNQLNWDFFPPWRKGLFLLYFLIFYAWWQSPQLIFFTFCQNLQGIIQSQSLVCHLDPSNFGWPPSPQWKNPA